MALHATDDVGPRLYAAKTALRQRILSARDALDAETRRAAAFAATDRMLVLATWRQSRVVAATLSIGSELDTGPLLAAAKDAGKRLVLPRVDKATRMLDLFSVDDPDTQLAPGVWGIREPIPDRCARMMPHEVDFVVVPGIAFDRAGGRLGYGGGFYDRLLPLLRADTTRIALAYAMQMVDRVPRGPTDVRIDGVVTEDEAVLVG